MSALEQSKFSLKVTFQGLLEQQHDEKKVEEILIKKLSKYSSSLFSDDSWIMDKGTDKSHNDRVRFHMFKEMGNKVVRLMKLFAIVLFERNASIDHVMYLNKYIQFLSQENIIFLQVNKRIFASYSYWLDSQKKEDGESYTSSYKYMLLDSVLKFHTYMNMHSSLAYIQGVESIENHYTKKSESEKYKVIDESILEKLDIHFMTDESPLHIRVAYWIMRMYATRPTDTLNYPLDCVKKLSKDMGTIKHAIVKNSKSARGIDYKIEYLNLKEPMQKMLYKLIKKQQEISLKLQDNRDNNDKTKFLLTYKVVQRKKIQYLSNQVLSRYFKKIQINLNIPEINRARPRDFKKSGITYRLEDGWSTPQLKNFANHRTYASIDSYTEPSKRFMIEQQREILLANKEISSRYMFRGKIINGLDDAYEKKLLKNPKAHKISNLGYCPNTAGCGNHYECLDCDDLVPDKELEEYYLEQVDRYLKITEKQYETGDQVNAKDSYHRASLFAALYNKLSSSKDVE